MPLLDKFKIFSPKRPTPTRKAAITLAGKDLGPKDIERELGPDVGPVRLHLSDQEIAFHGGTWVPESGKVGAAYKENEKLRKEMIELEEENNVLKLKLELAIDMLTETTSEAHYIQEELEQLKMKLTYRKRSAA